MKNKRHETIAELIENTVLTTQDDLQDALSARGFQVTQSTVSRDIKELGIVKLRDSDGIYRYAMPKRSTDTVRDRNHFEEMFAHSCTDVIYSMNTVIIKCYAGMASSACVSLDHLFGDTVLGSLAGDDTVFAITAGEQESSRLCSKLKKLL